MNDSKVSSELDRSEKSPRGGGEKVTMLIFELNAEFKNLMQITLKCDQLVMHTQPTQANMMNNMNSNARHKVIEIEIERANRSNANTKICLLYTSPSPRDRQKSRMPSSA